jgi:hypothetical protein
MSDVCVSGHDLMPTVVIEQRYGFLGLLRGQVAVTWCRRCGWRWAVWVGHITTLVAKGDV